MGTLASHKLLPCSAHALTVEPDDSVNGGNKRQSNYERTDEFQVRSAGDLGWKKNQEEDESPEASPARY